MNGARFDIYGRYEIDVERDGDRWVVYERREGKRRQHPNLFIPPEVAQEELATYLDDLLHEEGVAGRKIERLL